MAIKNNKDIKIEMLKNRARENWMWIEPGANRFL